VTGVIGAGQVNAGGGDGYLAKLDSKGKLVYEKQFGTSGKDSVAATAVTAAGDLVVASMQNGHAILAKYTGGDATSAPAWQMDLGALQNGGSISGLAVSGNQIYVSGSTQNMSLDAGGTATIATASSGSSDAFVFNATDDGASVTANTVSYVGTSGIDKAGGLTVGSDGTVYLTGTTTGTFTGQVRNATGTDNMFVTAMASDGSIDWTRQYGGANGQSAGQGIAIDENRLQCARRARLAAWKRQRQSDDRSGVGDDSAGGRFVSNPDSGHGGADLHDYIDQGETLQSLVTKINGEFGSNGQASINYGSGGEDLKIAVKPGVTAKLVAGPTNFDPWRASGSRRER